MMKIKKFNQLIVEHKLWGKSIQEFLNWLESKCDQDWAWIDTETTGLSSDKYDVQLTQIASIVTKYDFGSNQFSEIDSFNKKLKLTDKTKRSFDGNRIKGVLKFNHYGQKNTKYYPEDTTIEEFFEWLEDFEDPLFVIQNAIFDMKFLNTRNKGIIYDNDVLDTKQIIQLFYLPALQKLAETDPKYKETITKIGTSDRDNGLISSSMSKIGPALGINMSGYHDALTDCRITIQMFQRIIDFLKQNKSIDISKYQGERINRIR